MARTAKTVYEITDDLTGEAISEDEAVSIDFSYGGSSYTIDLSKKNADKLDSFLAPYIDAAKKVSRSTSKSKTVAPSRPGVLDWAKKEGHLKADHRGRIPNKVLEAYDAAH